MDDILIESAGVYRDEIKVPSRTRRKLAGSTLCLSIFAYVILLPIALVGQLFALIGFALKWPIRKLGTWMLPAAVRLWYIHRVGRIHPWQCAKTRNKQKLGAHSRTTRVDVISSKNKNLSIHVIPQLHDNYAYLIVNTEAHVSKVDQTNRITNELTTPRNEKKVYRAIVFDCGDALELMQQIQSIENIHYRDGRIELEAILTTHHHWDHMGGNDKLLELCPSIRAVYGGRRDRVLSANKFVKEGDLLKFLDSSCEIYCHETPAHTLGSITYRLVTRDHAHDCLFLGDTFFIGGSGANFEGDLEMMTNNFHRLYLTSSPNTLLFPGHEYSERIMATLFPDQAADLIKLDWLRYQVLASQYARIVHLRNLPHPAPTVPITLEIEVNYNPHFQRITEACRILMAAIYTRMTQKDCQAEIEIEKNPFISVNSQNATSKTRAPPWPSSLEVANSTNQPSSALGAMDDLSGVMRNSIGSATAAAAATAAGGGGIPSNAGGRSDNIDRPVPEHGLMSVSTLDSAAAMKWDKMAPRITVMENRCVLIEPPWILGAEINDIPKSQCQSVQRGFELFYNPKRLYTSIASISEALWPLLLPASNNQYVASIAMLEKCAKNPMGSGFPGLSDPQLRTFKQQLVSLLDLSEDRAYLPNIIVETSSSRNIDHHPLSSNCAGGPYLSAETFLAWVVLTLEPNLSQICKVYGKKFKDLGRPAPLAAASQDYNKTSSIDSEGGGNTTSGGSGATTSGGGATTSGISRAGCVSIDVKVPYHDFTDCQICGARPIYVHNSSSSSCSPPSSVMMNQPGGAADSYDNSSNILKRKPTTISVVDCCLNEHES